MEDVALLLCAVRAISALARLSLGPLLPLLSQKLPMGIEDKGVLLSAFSTGYLLTQVAGGVLADRVGGRQVVLLALAVNSVGLAMVPTTALTAGVLGLSAVYFMLGIFNGPLFPCCSVMLRGVEPHRRASAMAVVDLGGTLGGCLATALCPSLALWLGWQQLYGLLALLSAVTALLWWARAREPATEAAVKGSPDAGGKPSSLAGEAQQLRGAISIFLHPGPWALFCAHATFNYSNYFLNAWLPSMFAETFDGMDVGTAGVFLFWPEIVGIVSRLATSALAERCCAHVRLQVLRRAASVIAFTGQAVALCAAVRQPGPLQCTAYLALAAAFVGAHSCGFKANYLDLTAKHSGILAGAGNTIASVASAVGPLITSSILAAAPGDWARLFQLLAVLNICGAALVAALLSTESLDSAGQPWQKN